MTPGIAEPIGWERALLAAEKVKECLGDGVAADDRVRHAGPVQRARRAAQVARVDEDAVRNTKDVDILVRRADFPAVRAALEAVGFIYHHVWGVDASTDGPQGKPSGGNLVWGLANFSGALELSWSR